MKNIATIFLILITCNTITKAQVPGYQGKKFFVELGGSFSSDYLYLPTVILPGRYRANPFIPRFRANVGYVFSRKNTIELGYVFSRVKDKTPFIDRSIYSLSPSSLADYLVTHRFRVDMSSYLSNKGNLAPVGVKYSYGLSLLHHYYETGVRPYDGRYFDVGFNFGVGYRAVFANRITFDTYIDFCLVPQPFLNVGITFYDKVLINNLVSVNISIGVLLF